MRLNGWAHGGQPVAQAVCVFWTEARGRSHELVVSCSLTVRDGSKFKAEDYIGGAQEEQRVGAVDPQMILNVCLGISAAAGLTSLPLTFDRAAPNHRRDLLPRVLALMLSEWRLIGIIVHTGRGKITWR